MKKKALFIFISSLLLVYLAMFCFSLLNQGLAQVPKAVDEQIISVEKGELIGDGKKTKVTLPEFFDVDKSMQLNFTLNYAFSAQTVPSLVLQANHTFMTIILDGEEIYHVNPQAYSLGNYFVNVHLPQVAKGAQLEIHVSVPENGIDRIQIPNLIIGNEAVILREQALDDTFSLLLNTLILLSGFILLILAILGKKKIDSNRMLLRGFLAINSALYFMCETYIVVFLYPLARTTYMIDMLSFAALCPPLLVLIGWELDDWRKKLLNSIAGISMASAIAQIILALVCGVELRKLLPMTHAMQSIGILAVVVCIIYGLLRKKQNKGLFFAGFIALGGALDLILFMLEIGQNNVFFMKIGLLLYLLQQMYQFVHLLMKNSADEARESFYKTLALQEPLSKCYSRAAFELDKGAWDGKTICTVFFLDINDLKTANDLYGHSSGDQLIHALGEVLNHVFFSVGKCYRVGGDEFWAVCDNLSKGQSKKMIDQVQRETDTYNRNSNLPMELKFAIGVCDTMETNGDLNQAIEFADKRMYENKRIQKSKTKL